MPVSTLEYIKEKVRQGVTQDFNFYKKFTYFFELEIPPVMASVVVPGISSSFFFPLIIPPESYTLEESFSVEATPTLGGGLYVEENGIIQRTIRLRGNTGFKPRQLKTLGGIGGPVPAVLSPSAKSHSRSLPVAALMDLSGHRHFQYLQDSVFRIYADLKKDPAAAERTNMYFHNPKDDEHWHVVPQRFTLERVASRTVLYDYNIELLVTGPAAIKNVDLSEDKNWVDQAKDVARTVKKGIDTTSGALNDLTAMTNDLKTAVNNITVILDSVTNVLDSAEDFVNGVKDLIDAPHAWVNSIEEMIEQAGSLAESLRVEDDFKWSDKSAQDMRRLVDGLELIGMHPEVFVSSADTQMRTVRDNQETRRIVSDTTIEIAENSSAPTTFVEQEALGTALTPGEVISMGGETTAGGDVKTFQSARPVEIGQGDTLVSIAAKYMGDARLWQYIAVANGLKPPFIDMQATTPIASGGADILPFPAALGVGSTVMVPSNSSSTLGYPLLPVMGVDLDAPMEEQLLGVDGELVPTANMATSYGRVQYDLEVDSEKGGTDVKLVKGRNNLMQVVSTRLKIELGTDLLYRNVGLEKIVGLNFTLSDMENAQFRVRDAILADPRIATIKNLEFEQQDDLFDIELDAEVRGFSETIVVRSVL